MSRYIDPSKDILDLFQEIKTEHFEDLANCFIKIIIDTKKKKSKGEYIVASIKKTNEKDKFFTMTSLIPSGYDFFLFLDGNLFDNLTKDDQKKVIRHELRHIAIDLDKNDPYFLVDHDVQDFAIEIKLNESDPNWKERIAQTAESIYEDN